MGREASVTAVHQLSCDVLFTDGSEAKNVGLSLVQPRENLVEAKQLSPPAYSSSDTQMLKQTVNSTPYQYPSSQQPQSQPPSYSSNNNNNNTIYYSQTVPFQPQQQQQQQQQYYLQGQQQPQQYQAYTVGVAGTPVVHGVASSGAVSVSACPANLTMPANSNLAGATRVANTLPGYEHSPPIGRPLPALCDCNAPYIMACCCPCVLGGQTAQRIDMSSYSLVVCGYISLCFLLLIIGIIINFLPIYVFLWILWSIFVMMLRSRVRRMWQIPGDGCDDCCISFCCTSCALSQTAKHVFGLRSSDNCIFNPDGRPTWQLSADEAAARRGRAAPMGAV